MLHSICHDLQKITGKSLEIVILTDSLSLFDVSTKATATTEKRLMIDLAAAKESYKKKEIETIGFVRTEDNPGDVFTKFNRCKMLEEIIRMSVLNHSVEQGNQDEVRK
jgi:hypothetical protein